MPNAPRPSITAVFAQSLDGRISFRAAGSSARERAVFSTDEGAAYAHRARAAHDAVLVGVRTVIADDPRLSVRLCAGAQPRRVVLDSALAIPLTSRLIAEAPHDEGGAVLVFGAEGRASTERRSRLVARGVEACIVPAAADGRVSLPAALDALAARGVRRLLIEGGAAVLTSFLHAKLVDYVSIDIAPLFVGETGLAAIGDLGVAALPSAPRLDDVRVERLGRNLLVQGRLRYADDGATS